jgi:hypothetical protein
MPRKYCFNILLQEVLLYCVAEADYKFKAGGAGWQSDGGTFAASTLYTLLEDKKVNVPDTEYLPHSLIKALNVLIGDEAYLLKTYLIRPYLQNDSDSSEISIQL